MITYLKIKNFMSHDLLEFDFSENFYVITGKNDIGKSAIFHAIRWLFQNEPQGNHMIKQGKKSCEVTIRLNNGNDFFEITRKKTATNNTYFINGEEFHKNETPEELKKFFNQENVGDEKINWNFTFQHDSLFLLGTTNNTNIALLNTDTKVDEAIKITKSNILDCNKQLKYNLENTAKLENFLEQARPIDKSIVQLDDKIKDNSLLYENTKYSIIKLRQCFFANSIAYLQKPKEISKLLKARFVFVEPITKIKLSPFNKLAKLPQKLVEIKPIKIQRLSKVLLLAPLTEELKEIAKDKQKLIDRKEIINKNLSTVTICPTCKRVIV